MSLAPGTWACWTDRDVGDLAPTSADGADAVTARRAAVAPYPWTWLHQVHGARTVRVDRPGTAAGAEADAAVTSVAGAVVSVLTADCASVALWSDEGCVGAVHAGWRGLVRGVLESAVDALHDLGAGVVHARVGPVIGPCCYEFGGADLDDLAGEFGPGVRARTTEGRPSLDLVAGASVALARIGVALDASGVVCTACAGSRWFSHRARRDTGRQALAVWREGEP